MTKPLAYLVTAYLALANASSLFGADPAMVKDISAYVNKTGKSVMYYANGSLVRGREKPFKIEANDKSVIDVVVTRFVYDGIEQIVFSYEVSISIGVRGKLELLETSNPAYDGVVDHAAKVLEVSGQESVEPLDLSDKKIRQFVDDVHNVSVPKMHRQIKTTK